MELVFCTVMKQEDFGISIRFPDFDDCITFGEDNEDAVINATETLIVYAMKTLRSMFKK